MTPDPALLLEGRGLAAMRGERLIFADVDFGLAGGAALMLAGPNGAGKTTLLRMIAGLTRPFAGGFYRRGQPVADDRDSHAGDLSLLGHRDGLKTALTVAENLTIEARLADRPDTDPTAALARFGMDDLADLPVGYLSLGQRRRAALARLLMAGATLWLLDEPLTGLDAEAAAILGEVMGEHLKAGGAIIAAGHGPLPALDAEHLLLRPPAPATEADMDAAMAAD